MFSLQVGVHHCNDRFVIAHLSNNDRHCFKFEYLTSRKPSMPRNQFVSAFRQRTGKRRCECTELLDALDQAFHLVVILDFKWVILKRVQLSKRNVFDSFQLGIVSFFLRGKQLVQRICW